MNNDRFKKYPSDVRTLVQRFENMNSRGSGHFFDVDQLVVIADFYLEQNDIDHLEHVVAYAEHLYPQNSDVLLRRAHLCCAKEQYAMSLEILQKLERLEPDNTDVHYAMGIVYGAMGQSRKAIQYYQMASVDGYQLDQIYGNIADEYYHMGLCDDAIRYYKKAVRENPDEERALQNLACCFEEEQLYDESRLFFQNFVRDHPYSKMAWFCLGDNFYGDGRYDKAVDAFEFALTIDKTFFNAYVSLSDCYRQLHDISKAVSTLRESVAYTDDKAYVQYSIAAIYFDAHNYTTAVLYFKMAAETDPAYGDAYISIAMCYSELNDYGAACDYMARAVELNPQSPVYLAESARIHARYGQIDKALPLFECAVRLADDCDPYWTDYADCLMADEQFEEAVEVLHRGLVTCMSPFDLHLRMAVCYYRLGQRNNLFGAIHVCMQECPELIGYLFEMCPAMADDYDIASIIASYKTDPPSAPEA